MAVGHVGADDEEQVGLVEVLIGTRRPVGAQRQLVAAAGAGHAQARIGFDMLGADEALGQLVGQVLRLQRHLARNIKGNGVGAMPLQDRLQATRRLANRKVKRHRQLLAGRPVADIGPFHAARLGDRLAAGVALGA